MISIEEVSMIKKVLIYTYGDSNQDNTIRAAANFANQHGASLTGLFVRPDFMSYSTIYGEYPLNLAQSYFDLQRDYAANVKVSFNKIVDQVDCPAEWHEIDEYDRKPNPALYADFIFVTQPSRESSVIFNDCDFIDHLIVQTGLPTVVIPTGWQAHKFGTRPLLGWNESKESVGAVRHTLALMREAEQVDVVTANKTGDSDADLITGIEISAYLAAHDISCKYFSVPMQPSEPNESATLLRHAQSNDCDLIIVGGYGHSRLREIVLGGVTRGLLRNSNVPITLSH